MRSVYKRIAGIVIVAVIFYFIGRFFYREWDEISGYNWVPSPLWLISSIVVLLLTYLLFGFGWTLILRMIHVKIDWAKGVSIFLLSLFGRYIPGGIWSVLGRVYLCRLEGIPDSRSSMSILLEQAYPVVSAGLVFAVSLLFWDDTGPAKDGWAPSRI